MIRKIIEIDEEKCNGCGLCAKASVRYFNLIQGVSINTDNYVLNYPLYQAALKEVRKSGYVLDENDINDTEKAVKDKREIFELAHKVLVKVHRVVEEETALARKIAMDILSYFDNIDIEDELEASDIRDIINEIQCFYQKCFAVGINISIIDDAQFKKIKDSSSAIAKAMLILQKDYSDEDDISVLYAFSSNSIGVVLPFLEMLKKVNKDIDTAYEQMQNEKESSVISAALDGIKKNVTAVWTALKNLIKTGQLDIKNVISTTWNAAKDVVNTALNAIKSVVQTIWNAMPEIVRNPMNQVKDAVLSIWDNIKNGIGDRLGGVRDAVTNAMNAVYSAVMDKVNSSWSWGRDLMQNLINGITYMLGSLINTVADVARSIWEYLHFSVPEKGALTDVEEWMPDFMKGLAKGIDKSKKYVEAAVSGVADAMTLTMQSGLNVDMDGISGAMMNGGSGGVVNNYYNNDNSRTVNQTNNSPKSLSRLEIYRMTRNALNV